RAITGMVLLDFRVHGAGIGCARRLGFLRGIVRLQYRFRVGSEFVPAARAAKAVGVPGMFVADGCITAHVHAAHGVLDCRCVSHCHYLDQRYFNTSISSATMASSSPRSRAVTTWCFRWHWSTRSPVLFK